MIFISRLAFCTLKIGKTVCSAGLVRLYQFIQAFNMAQSVIRSPVVFMVDGDFFSTFKLQPEELIDEGLCGKIVLTKSLKDTDVRRVVKTFTLLDQEKKARNQQVFHAEVQFMQSFDHPYLMKCLIAGECPEYLAFSMYYYQRGTLDQYVGNLSLQLSELCVTQVACALRYMHNNHVAHFDVKLDNIYLDAYFNAILGDFGLAVEMFPDQQTLPKWKCGGTPCYFAPEWVGAPADKELDPYKMDSYCLGVVMWALVLERYPADNVHYYTEARQNRDLPSNVREWLLKLLESHPASRSTVASFLSRVRQESAFRYVIDNH